jgi:hypothetical protein
MKLDYFSTEEFIMREQTLKMPFWTIKRISSLICVFVFSILFIWVSPVHAQDIVYSGGIPVGSVVDQDVILSGSEIVIDGTVNGDVLAMGQLVTVNGTINGSLYSAAEILTISGKVSGSVYSAGGTLRLKPEAKLDRSAFFAGGLLDFQSGSSVSRDLYSLALGAQFNGTITRDTRAIIGPSELFKGFLNVTGIQMPVITLPIPAPAPAATPAASILSASMLPVSIPSLAFEPVNNFYPLSISKDLATFDWTAWIKSVLKTMAELLLVGALLAWLASGVLAKIKNQGTRHPWQSLFYGLCAMVVVFSGLVLALTMVIMLGSFFNWVSLTTIAWITWVGGSAIVITAASLYFFVLVIVSKLVAAYLVGSWLMSKLAPHTNAFPLWSILIGIVLYSLLISIPSLGGLIALFATLFGMGACWLWLRGRINTFAPLHTEENMP